MSSVQTLADPCLDSDNNVWPAASTTPQVQCYDYGKQKQPIPIVVNHILGHKSWNNLYYNLLLCCFKHIFSEIMILEISFF